MILKIQRPIVTTEPAPLMLIYNQDRSIDETLPMTEELFSLFGDEYKLYIEAEIVEGVMQIQRVVEEQSW